MKGQLRKNENGEWVLRFRTGGRGTPNVYRNFGAVKAKRAHELASREIVKMQTRRSGADPSLTFEALSEKYVESEGEHLSKRGKALAEMVLRCHLVPFFGEMRVETMRAADVDRYRKQRVCLVGKKKRKRSERPISSSTFNREWSLLRAVLNFGERTELIERNPIRRGAVRLLPTSPRVAFFEPGEWTAFIAAAEGAPADLAGTVPFWRSLLLTGRRISELVALRWKDVDLDRGAIRFFQEKTKRAVTLPLAGELAEVVRALARFRRIEAEAPVFLDAKGIPLDVKTLQTAFRRIARRAKLTTGEHGKLTPHSIRHTAATWARREGVPLDRIAAVLGHADLRMTMRTYAHIRPEDLSPALDVLAGIEKGAREKAARDAETGTGSKA
jgi:integrase